MARDNIYFVLAGFLLLPLFLRGIDINAQSVYPDLCPMDYYNMDTSKIILIEGVKYKESYSSSEIKSIFAGQDPDSTADLSPCGDLFCGHVGNFNLPLMRINDAYVKRQIAKLVKKAISGGYSKSPDTLISRGFFLRMFVYQKDSIPMFQLETNPNYYMWTSFKYIERSHPGLKNTFISYYQNFLIVVTCENDTVGDLIKRKFAETMQRATIHAYKKHCEKLLVENPDEKDVHSTAYGLYRRYMLKKTRWVESYL